MKFEIKLYRDTKSRGEYSLVMRVNGGQEVHLPWDRRAVQTYINGVGHGMFVATGKFGHAKLLPSHEVAFWLSANEIR